VSDQVERLLELVDGATTRKMFGGAGVYADGAMFAIAMGDELYLKVDEESRAEFEELGSGPFTPNERQTIRSFYGVPAEVASDDAELAAWAHRAIDAARRAQAT
jgi:DNA transformation protein